MEICPVGTELMKAEGQTIRMKITASFRNFAKAPKKDKVTAFKHHAMKARGNVKAKIHLFLTLLLKSLCGNRSGRRNADITRQPKEC